MVDLAKLVVRLEAETAKYQSELEKAKRQLSGFEKSSNVSISKIAAAAGVAATVAASGFVALAKSAIDSADAINDLSKSTGISVESLSQLKYAAELSGTDIDSLAKGMQKLSKSAVDASTGSKSAMEAFNALGVSPTNADGSLKDVDSLLGDIADAFSQFEDGAGKAAVAQDLFGQSGVSLIPFLNQGRKGIDDLRQEADRLGVTLSGDTTDAADEFKDNLTRLKASATGLATQVVTAVLPSMVDLTDQIVQFVTQGDGAQRIAGFIETAFKLLADIGSRVAETFSDVGNAFGAIAAAAVQAANGNFRQAYDIIVEANADAAQREKEYTDFREKLWEDAGKKIVATAQATDEGVKKSLSFGGNTSLLKEVDISVSKIEDSPMAAFYKEMDRLTQTSTEKAVAAYHEQLAALDFLYDEGLIKAEQYNARLAEIQSDTLGLDEVEITVKRVKENYEKATTELTEFQKQAARNTQDIIADSLTNGFKDGADGILQSFADMIVQLTAQAVAADIAGKLFGSAGGGSGSGWVGTAISAIGSFFGGTMDSGGRGRPGQAYAIGTGAQPEMFVPDGPGTFVPRDQWMGGDVKMSNTFVIQTPTGRVPLETQQQIATRTAQALAQAQRRNG